MIEKSLCIKNTQNFMKIEEIDEIKYKVDFSLLKYLTSQNNQIIAKEIKNVLIFKNDSKFTNQQTFKENIKNEKNFESIQKIKDIKKSEKILKYSFLLTFKKKKLKLFFIYLTKILGKIKKRNYSNFFNYLLKMEDDKKTKELKKVEKELKIQKKLEMDFETNFSVISKKTQHQNFFNNDSNLSNSFYHNFIQKDMNLSFTKFEESFEKRKTEEEKKNQIFLDFTKSNILRLQRVIDFLFLKRYFRNIFNLNKLFKNFLKKNSQKKNDFAKINSCFITKFQLEKFDKSFLFNLIRNKVFFCKFLYLFEILDFKFENIKKKEFSFFLKKLDLKKKSESNKNSEILEKTISFRNINNQNNYRFKKYQINFFTNTINFIILQKINSIFQEIKKNKSQIKKIKKIPSNPKSQKKELILATKKNDTKIKKSEIQINSNFQKKLLYPTASINLLIYVITKMKKIRLNTVFSKLKKKMENAQILKTRKQKVIYGKVQNLKINPPIIMKIQRSNSKAPVSIILGSEYRKSISVFDHKSHHSITSLNRLKKTSCEKLVFAKSNKNSSVIKKQQSISFDNNKFNNNSHFSISPVNNKQITVFFEKEKLNKKDYLKIDKKSYHSFSSQEREKKAYCEKRIPAHIKKNSFSSTSSINKKKDNFSQKNTLNCNNNIVNLNKKKNDVSLSEYYSFYNLDDSVKRDKYLANKNEKNSHQFKNDANENKKRNSSLSNKKITLLRKKNSFTEKQEKKNKRNSQISQFKIY